MTTKTHSSNGILGRFRVYDATGGGVTHDIEADSMKDALTDGAEWMLEGEWGEAQGNIHFYVEPIILDADGDEDADAMRDAREWGKAELILSEPDCPEGSHDWRSPYEVVGGIKENPGVWGSGHGSVKTEEVCSHCGRYKRMDYGASDSENGEQCTMAEYADADEKSAAWVNSLFSFRAEQSLNSGEALVIASRDDEDVATYTIDADGDVTETDTELDTAPEIPKDVLDEAKELAAATVEDDE